MKRFGLLFICLLLILALISCGAEPEKPVDTGTADDTAPASDTAPDSVTPDTAPDTGKAPEDDSELNNDVCVLRVTGLDEDSLWGVGVDVYCENKTVNSTLRFVVAGGSVNGVEADPTFSCDVAPQKSKNDTVNLTVPDELSDLEDYTDIELCFRVYNSDSLISEPIAEKTIHIYPQGEEKASVYVRRNTKDDTVLVDDDAVSIIVIGYGNDSLYDCIVNLYIINKTDRDLVFSTEDVKINGLDCDPLFSVTVRAGKSAFSSIGWLHSTLWEQRIREVSNVKMTLVATSDDGVVSEESVRIDLPSSIRPQ